MQIIKQRYTYKVLKMLWIRLLTTTAALSQTDTNMFMSVMFITVSGIGSWL